MGGLLQPRWRHHTDELEQKIVALTQELANLRKEVASLRGRLRGVENSAAAANSRCERVETRVGKLEARELLPDDGEGAETVFVPQGHQTCMRCQGTGRLGGGDGVVGLMMCPVCHGRGSRPPPPVHLPLPAREVELPARRKICPTCRGTGSNTPEKPLHIPHGLCSSCDGNGYLEVPS